MPIDQDATSLWFLPSDASQWTELLAGTAIGNPGGLWLLQEAAGTYADSIGTATLTPAFGYHNVLAGWSRFAPNQADGAGDQALNVADAGLPDLNTTSMLVLVIQAVTSTPGATRSLANIGPGGPHANNVEVNINTSNHYIITDGTNTGTGTTDHGTAAVIQVLRYDLTNTSTDLFVDDEKISKTFLQPAALSKGIWLGSIYNGAAPVSRLYAAAWYGVSAEMSDADVAILISRIKNGPVIARAPRRNFMSYPVTLDTTDADSVAVTNTAATFPTLLMDPGRDYAFTSTTDCWVCQGPFDQEATKAFLDLAGETANVTTVIEAQVAGTSGNSITLETVADGSGLGSLDESGYPAIVFHFEDAVTTVQDFEDAITASDNLAVKTSGVVSNTFADPGDVMSATNLAGAVNESLVTPVATAGAGSVFVPALFTVYLDGARGDSLSVIRDSADGVSSLTPIARDKIGVH